MNTSEQINELAAALAKAQAAIKPAAKDAKNPHFNSRYADLAGVWAACREPLSANGLSVVQMPVDSEAGRVALVTTLLHASGQWISSMVSTRLQKDDAQGVGSALTYLRRYALAAMVGVVADEDDDGNGASGKAADKPTRAAPATYTPAVAPEAKPPNVEAKLRFLAFASEITGKPIRSWGDALKVWKTNYDEPQTVDEWRACASAFRAAVKPTQAGLAAEYEDIEQTERQVSNGAAGVGR